MEEAKLPFKKYYYVVLLILVNFIAFSILYAKYRKTNEKYITLKNEISDMNIEDSFNLKNIQENLYTVNKAKESISISNKAGLILLENQNQNQNQNEIQNTKQNTNDNSDISDISTQLTNFNNENQNQNEGQQLNEIKSKENHSELASLDEVAEETIKIKQKKQKKHKHQIRSNNTNNLNNSTLVTSNTNNTNNSSKDDDNFVSDMGQNIHGGLGPLVTTANQIFILKDQ